MTDQPQPQPADLSDESNEGLLTAYFRNGMTFAVTADAEERRHVNARGADIRAELESRLTAAAPPSGQVCISREDAKALHDAMEHVAEHVWRHVWEERYQGPFFRLGDAINGLTEAEVEK